MVLNYELFGASFWNCRTSALEKGGLCGLCLSVAGGFVMQVGSDVLGDHRAGQLSALVSSVPAGLPVDGGQDAAVLDALMCDYCYHEPSKFAVVKAGDPFPVLPVGLA